MCEFLTERFEVADLEASTVCNYRTAIQTIHRGFSDGSKTNESEPVRAVLNGMFHVKPPTRPILPSWDLITVLEFMAGPPFEPWKDAAFRDLTRKTGLCYSWRQGVVVVRSTRSVAGDAYRPQTGLLRFIFSLNF